MATCQCQIEFLIFLLISTFSSCHYLTKPGSIIRGVRSDGKNFLTRSADKSLKIFVYEDDRSMQKLSLKLRKLVAEKLLPDAVEYFGKTLRVRRRISPIRLQRECKEHTIKNINGIYKRYCTNSCKSATYCGAVKVPEPYLDVCNTCNSAEENCTSGTSRSAGITNVDVILFVSAVTMSNCNNHEAVLAYASACQQEESLDRPVAGFVNFCVDQLAQNLHYSHLLEFIKHEIFHILGFSSSLYGYYRADDGMPLTNRLPDGRPILRWSDKVIKEITRDKWQVSPFANSTVSHKVQMIVTPRVVKEVREHFNCSTLEGAEIENQGSSGQRHSHLEKRVFENEAMTAVFTNKPMFSRITLAVMEDTGWYWANYEMAEDLDWGRNAGCLFAQNSCKAWMDHQTGNNNSILPYCTHVSPEDHTRTACTHNYQGVGICNLVKYPSPLPTAYQYFTFIPGVDYEISGLLTATYFGGETSFADYCPYYQELNWKQNGKAVRGSNCRQKSNNPSSDINYALERYGDNSSCFLHGRKWSQKSCSRTVTAVNWGSGCYSYECTVNGLVLSISGTSYPCWFANQTLDIQVVHENNLYRGSIICPVCRDLCGGTCPLVETRDLYNSATLQKHVLVCASGHLHQNFAFLTLFVIISVLNGLNVVI